MPELVAYWCEELHTEAARWRNLAACWIGKDAEIEQFMVPAFDSPEPTGAPTEIDTAAEEARQEAALDHYFGV